MGSMYQKNTFWANLESETSFSIPDLVYSNSPTHQHHNTTIKVAQEVKEVQNSVTLLERVGEET